MQNLRLIALLVLEIRRHKISLGRREQIIKLSYLPWKTDLKFNKCVFMSGIVLLDPKLTPRVNFQQFSSREKLSC